MTLDILQVIQGLASNDIAIILLAMFGLYLIMIIGSLRHYR